MIINLNIKQFRQGLSKLCKVASITSSDVSSQLKFTAKNKMLIGEAINENRTQSIAIKFDENICSVQEEGSFCIPAKSFQQTIDLMLGDTIELSSSNNIINIKSLPHDNKDEIQSIEGFDIDQWLSIAKTNFNKSIILKRDFFIDIGHYTANCCSYDKSKAPLTAIHINILQDGKIQCTSTDYVRISLYDYYDDTNKNNIEENICFMLPTDVAKKIPYIFDKDIDLITAKIDERKVVLQGGDIIFGFSTEAGLDKYPPLRNYLEDKMNLNYKINLNEIIRISGLLSAIADKSICNIIFKKDNISFETEDKNNKSKQSLNCDFISGNIDLPQNIKIAVYDLVSSLSIPQKEELEFGLISIKDSNLGHLLEIKQVSDNTTWRQIILKAREIITEEDE